MLASGIDLYVFTRIPAWTRTHGTRTLTCTHPPAFPSDGRDICVPSVDENDRSIRTLVVTFSDRPSCVEVLGAPSDTLASCSPENSNSTVYVDTRNLFEETETGEFDLVVDGQNTAVEYGKLAM